jgi:hypothetical protein
MGYDLHITRAERWNEPMGEEITASEWSGLVAQDPELVTDEENGPYAAVWEDPEGNVRGWFDWYGGAVFTTNPDQDIVRKLLELAAQLNARVQGDDGEFYEKGEDWTAG